MTAFTMLWLWQLTPCRNYDSWYHAVTMTADAKLWLWQLTPCCDYDCWRHAVTMTAATAGPWHPEHELFWLPMLRGWAIFNIYYTKYGHCSPQSEIYRRGNVVDHWNSSVARRSPLKAILGFPSISNHFHYRKCRFPDIGILLDMPMISALNHWNFQSK